MTPTELVLAVMVPACTLVGTLSGIAWGMWLERRYGTAS